MMPMPQLVPDAMKTKTLDGFGPRLAAIRQAQGMTQTELGKLADTSQRMIAYYELESAQPPGALLVDLARALKVSTDELFGLAPLTAKTSPKTARLLKRLQRIEELPPADQRAVLKLVDARRRTASGARSKRKAS
jgi:transcriptional regulator with XRE-family HTH domain